MEINPKDISEIAKIYNGILVEQKKLNSTDYSGSNAISAEMCATKNC